MSDVDSGKSAASSSFAGSESTAASFVTAASVEERVCWVCFANDEDEPSAVWLRPCQCMGSLRWVHEACLQRWVDEKQRGGASSAAVPCPHCGAAYAFVYPQLGALVGLLEWFDGAVNRVAPLVSVGVVLAGVGWCAVTQGALTLVQLMGRAEALALVDRHDPLTVAICLPMLPVALLLGRFVRWQQPLVRFLFRRSSVYRSRQAQQLRALDRSTRPVLADDATSAARLFVGALLAPTAAFLTGQLLFKQRDWPVWRRSLAGGVCYVGVKGAVDVYYKYSQLVRKLQRRIVDLGDVDAPQKRH